MKSKIKREEHLVTAIEIGVTNNNDIGTHINISFLRNEEVLIIDDLTGFIRRTPEGEEKALNQTLRLTPYEFENMLQAIHEFMNDQKRLQMEIAAAASTQSSPAGKIITASKMGVVKKNDVN